jgi:hypothetical protein
LCTIKSENDTAMNAEALTVEMNDLSERKRSVVNESENGVDGAGWIGDLLWDHATMLTRSNPVKAEGRDQEEQTRHAD